MTTTTNNKTIDEHLKIEEQVIEKNAGINAIKVPAIISYE
ncbi:Asp23/Gls24 family envelope stress response protein, partial [Limosilactobacillus reuteri]